MAYKSPDCRDDLVYDHLPHADAAKPPKTLDLSHFARPPRNQGHRGTCAAIAGAAIREIHYYKTHGAPCEQLSPEFIYHHRQTSPAPGMFGRDVFRVLTAHGVCSEDDHPYEAASPPSRKAVRHARRYKIATYARIYSLDALKQALYNVGPCFISLPKYSSGSKFWRAKSRRKLRDSAQTGHAVVVLGYTRKGFIIQNSWGEDWNEDGTTILPYKDYGVVWEAWVPLAHAPRAKCI